MDVQRLEADLIRAAQDLQLERDRCHELQAELGAKQEESERLRQKWKQAALELNGLKTQGQNSGVDRLTDQEVVDKVQQLRYTIRNFAFEHFENHVPDVTYDLGALDELQERLDLPRGVLRAHLGASAQRPLIVRAYIWRVLVRAIYQFFYWCPGHASSGMWNVWQLLSATTWDRQRLRHWRVETATLLTQTKLSMQSQRGGGRAKEYAGLINKLYSPLSRLSQTPARSLGEQLELIMDQFLDLDRLLSMQTAEYEWNYPPLDGASLFSENDMELERGERLVLEEARVVVVLEPGFQRGGNGNPPEPGQRLQDDQPVQLLRMVVTCRKTRRPRPSVAREDGDWWTSKFARIFHS